MAEADHQLAKGRLPDLEWWREVEKRLAQSSQKEFGSAFRSAVPMVHLLWDQGLRETRMGAPNVYFSPSASTTAASVVSSRKVKVSCRYSSTIVLEWLK
jgi:hypothetical protein